MDGGEVPTIAPIAVLKPLPISKPKCSVWRRPAIQDSILRRSLSLKFG